MTLMGHCRVHNFIRFLLDRDTTGRNLHARGKMRIKKIKRRKFWRMILCNDVQRANGSGQRLHEKLVIDRVNERKEPS